ncbi:MAG: hypothetical protein L6R37_008059 [Teloschistes peruensis]|nr:MAG: hypothetical protein L6R37_008059 [Teloschistes peruensis]
MFFSEHIGSPELEQITTGSLMVNQKARALDPPARRPYTSNVNRPKSFWQEMESLKQPRPRLYKQSIIGNAYMEYAPGQAFAHQDPGRDLDLFIDFRVVQSDVSLPVYMEEPPSKSALLSAVREFSTSHPTAKFALLRLWSASHFWSLMVGMDRRAMFSFRDARRRPWEFNFLPKDFPHSEKSMHSNLSNRMKKYEHVLRGRTFVKRDLVIVMGTDEEDLLRLATATTFAIVEEPWRLEADLWRSFVNVGLGFLEGLHEEWLE